MKLNARIMRLINYFDKIKNKKNLQNLDDYII